MYSSASPEITSELWIAIPAVMLLQPFFKSFSETLGKELAGVLSAVIKKATKYKTSEKINIVFEKEDHQCSTKIRLTTKKKDLEYIQNNINICIEELIALLKENAEQKNNSDNKVEISELKCAGKDKNNIS